MNTDSHRVLLVNASINSSTGPVKLCGYSGASYGFSVYDSQRNAHVVEMSLEDYHKGASDIMRNAYRPRCQWVAHFLPSGVENVITPTNSPELRELCLKSARQLSYEDLMRLIDERPETARNVNAYLQHQHDRGHDLNAALINPNVSLTIPVSSELPTKYFGWVKLAKSLDVPIQDEKGERYSIASLREAILAKQQRAA